MTRARVQQAISERFILPGLQVFACVLRGLVNGLPPSLASAASLTAFLRSRPSRGHRGHGIDEIPWPG